MRLEEQGTESVSSRIIFLDGLRGFAIVMVVATHAIAYASVDKSVAAFLSFWIQSVAVPPFFLADGFLFVRCLQNNAKFSCANYCARSARRLLLPWILFSFLYMIFRAGFEIVAHPPELVVLGHTFGELLNAIYYSSISAQLYFLPALFIVRLFCFATKYLTSLRFTHLIVVWLLYVTVWQSFWSGNNHYEHLDPLVNALWGMQYYFLGMALSVCEGNLIRKPFLLVGVTLTILLGVKVVAPAWVVFAQNAYVCSLFFVFLGFARHSRPFVGWGAYTMGVYLIHAPIVIKAVSYLFGIVFRQSSIMRYVGITVATFFISMLASQILARFSWWRFMLGEGVVKNK